MRIKTSEVQAVRAKMYKQQKGICLLCKKPMKPSEAVLDHDHGTGYVRGVLHTSCNGAEGRIASAIYRSRSDKLPENLVDFVKNLAVYWEKDYSSNVVHPKHLIPEEKELKRMKKYQKGLKTEAGKAKKQLEIDALQLKIKELLKEI